MLLALHCVITVEWRADEHYYHNGVLLWSIDDSKRIPLPFGAHTSSAVTPLTEKVNPFALLRIKV